MPTYSYIAKKNLDETVEGIIVADTQESVIDRLIELGLTPVRVEAVEEKGRTAAQAPRASFLSGRGLNRKDLSIFTNQLKSLMNAKVDLLKSLSILYGQAEKERLRTLILDIHSRIKNGATFSSALAEHEYFFPNIFINLIRIGEASGRLDEVLEELDRFLAKEEEFKMHVKTAMAYPTLMISVGICVIFVLFTYVIPKLSAIFVDFDYALPLPTQIMLSISHFFSSFWWAVLVGAGFLIIVFIGMSKTESGRAQLDWLKIHIPVFGALSLKQSLSRFCRTLALLIRSGLPVFKALEVAIPTLENAIFTKELEVVRKDVMEGSSLATSMKKVTFFPSFLVQMVSVGEEGGKLEGVLNEIANIYTQETDARLKMITSLLEPVIILILGLILGGIVMAMLLPIFQINLLIK